MLRQTHPRRVVKKLGRPASIENYGTSMTAHRMRAEAFRVWQTGYSQTTIREDLLEIALAHFPSGWRPVLHQIFRNAEYVDLTGARADAD